MTAADLHNVLYILADKASDAINPVFMALVAEEPLRLRERQQNVAKANKNAKNVDAAENVPSIWSGTLRFWGRTILAVGAAVVLAELGKKMQVWPGHSNFPSGHTTFAASCAACLVLHRGRAWLWLAAPLVVLMGAALVYGQWHTVDEVVAALFLGPSVAWSVWQATAKRKPPRDRNRDRNTPDI